MELQIKSWNQLTWRVPSAQDNAARIRIVAHQVDDLFQLIHTLTRVVCVHVLVLCTAVAPLKPIRWAKVTWKVWQKWILALTSSVLPLCAFLPAPVLSVTSVILVEYQTVMIKRLRVPFLAEVEDNFLLQSQFLCVCVDYYFITVSPL